MSTALAEGTTKSRAQRSRWRSWVGRRLRHRTEQAVREEFGDVTAGTRRTQRADGHRSLIHCPYATSSAESPRECNGYMRVTNTRHAHGELYDDSVFCPHPST